jgi:hypothetical protein
MSVWPPRGIGTIPRRGPAGNIPTFSWLYMPFILDAAGADLDTLFRPAPDGIPRERNWIRYGEALRVALDQADITLASIMAEVGPLLHLTAQRQQEILRLCPPAAAFATRETWRPLLGPSAVKLCDVWCARRTLPLDVRRCCRLATPRMRFTRCVCDSWSYSMVVTPAALIAEMQSSPRPLPFPLHPHPQAASPASHRALRLWREPAPPACQSSLIKPTRADGPRRLTGAPSAPYVRSLSARRGTSFPMSGSLTLMLCAWIYNALGLEICSRPGGGAG